MNVKHFVISSFFIYIVNVVDANVVMNVVINVANVVVNAVMAVVKIVVRMRKVLNVYSFLF